MHEQQKLVERSFACNNITMMSLSSLWDFFCVICGIGTIMSLTLYLLPIAVLSFAKPQDLRAKYGEWAVVTGGSSGIGRALVRKLASQGINVFIVALDDDLLLQTHSKLTKEFPDVQLRPVPVNLGGNAEGYMTAVENATKDVAVAILINNAGFLKMDYFEQGDMGLHAANIECNAVAAIRLTHYFYRRMMDQNIKGCIAFTSSAVFFMPSPFACMYGATKAMLSQFASSLAIEAQSHGIDVTVFHPSYTHSNLYVGAPKLGVLTLLSKFGWTPDEVAEVFFASIGRVVVRDIGLYAIATNLLGRWIDAGFLALSIIPFRDSMAPPGAKQDTKAKKEI